MKECVSAALMASSNKTESRWQERGKKWVLAKRRVAAQPNGFLAGPPPARGLPPELLWISQDPLSSELKPESLLPARDSSGRSWTHKSPASWTLLPGTPRASVPAASLDASPWRAPPPHRLPVPLSAWLLLSSGVREFSSLLPPSDYGLGPGATT